MKETPKKKQKKTNSDKPKKARVKTPAMLKNPGGRPSEFDESSKKIIQFIRGGNTYECSAGCSGVSYSTFAHWIRQGKEDLENNVLDSKYLKFLKDVEKAEMEAEEEVVRAWRNFIPQNWQAARDFLSRRNPDKWGTKDKVDVTSTVEVSQKAKLEIPDNGNREI